MIPRYSLPEMADLFTDEARLRRVARGRDPRGRGVGRARRRAGGGGARAVRERAGFDVAAIDAREQITEHDVAAFVDVVQDQVGQPEGAWVHYGLTSSDVVDTALVAPADPGRRPAARRRGRARGRDHAPGAASTATRRWSGRTHGIHAEPTTFGVKLALWALQVRRDVERLRAGPRRDRGRQALGRGRHLLQRRSRASRQHVCEHLGLTPVPATQVLARDRHAELLYACASRRRDASSRSPRDPPPPAHRGRARSRSRSGPGSRRARRAMPHKRNPVKSEQLCGLARVLRGNLGAGLENVALWHERDISHSSVERIILPDSCLLAYYVLVKFRAIVEGMHVYPERMLENLDASLRARVQPAGAARAGRGGPSARRRVPDRAAQRDAHLGGATPVPRRAARGPRRHRRRSTDEQLAACFDLKRAIAQRRPDLRRARRADRDA